MLPDLGEADGRDVSTFVPLDRAERTGAFRGACGQVRERSGHSNCERCSDDGLSIRCGIANELLRFRKRLRGR